MRRTIHFRIRSPAGPLQISSLTDQDKLQDLKAALVGMTGINRLKVLHGYPPRELDLSKEDALLGSYFKTLRESLIVSENQSSNVKEAAPQPEPTVSQANTQASSQASSQTSTQSSTPANQRNTQVITLTDSPTHSPTHRPAARPPTHSPAYSSHITASSNYLTIISAGFNKDTGRLVRKIVPANNSCLFTAVHFCTSNGKFNPNIGSELRKLIAEKVRSDPVQFNDAILGCPSAEYQAKIVKDDVWGGGIELAILSAHYGLEIVAVDIQNVRLNKFGEDKRYPTRCLLLFDGIHYDALYFELVGNEDQPITVFTSENQDLLSMALELAAEAKSRGQFTDVKNFKLKCLACNECIKGGQEADAHAKSTGHINFSEI